MKVRDVARRAKRLQAKGHWRVYLHRRLEPFEGGHSRRSTYEWRPRNGLLPAMVARDVLELYRPWRVTHAWPSRRPTLRR